MSTSGTDARRRQVEVYAEFPVLVERLLTDHVDNGHGRCSSSSCTTSGGYARARWPCGFSLLADEAADLIRSRRTI